MGLLLGWWNCVGISGLVSFGGGGGGLVLVHCALIVFSRLDLV